jgi:hypothetical protein
MKAAKPSPPKRRASRVKRAALSLDHETCRAIDALRGHMSRAEWVRTLILREANEHQERRAFIELVRQQYTPEVCRQTLQVNDEYPIHED